jgi:hypothetical protein
MRNATRISCHRMDDGSIVGEYRPEDRMSLSDIEKCVEDMLDAVDDNGEHEYSWTVSPEIITVEKIGTIAVLEIKLTSTTRCGRIQHDEYGNGLDADEIRSLRAQNSVRGWRI